MNKTWLNQLASDIEEKYGSDVRDGIFGELDGVKDGHKAISAWFGNFIKKMDELNDEEFVKKILVKRSPCAWKEKERADVIRDGYENSKSFAEFASLLAESGIISDKIEFNDNVLYLIKNPMDRKNIGACGKGCHCALACHAEEYASDLFCHCCTVGFDGRPFREVFGDDVRIEFIESFITNGNPCKTAVYAPEKKGWQSF